MTEAAESKAKPLARRVGAIRGTGVADQIRQKLEPHRDEVINKLVELAKAGDPACLKLYMERLAPPPRPEDEKVHVPGLADAPTLQAKAEAILQAAARGQISAAAGDRLMSLLDKYRLAIVATDHEARLQALEVGKVMTSIDGEIVPPDASSETTNGA